MYDLTKTRFKTTTRREVAKILLDLGKSKKINVLYCGGIARLVFSPVKSYWTFFNEKHGEGAINDQGDSGVYIKGKITTFNQFIKLANK